MYSFHTCRDVTQQRLFPLGRIPWRAGSAGMVFVGVLTTLLAGSGGVAAPTPTYTAEGFALFEAQTNPVFDIVFSPDGTTVITGGAAWPQTRKGRPLTEPEEVKVWDVETVRVRFQLESNGMGRGNHYCTMSLAISPDGKWFASGESAAPFGAPGRTLWILDSRACCTSGGGGAFGNFFPQEEAVNKLLARYEKENRHNHLWQLALSPDGKSLANTWGSHGGVEIEDVDIFVVENGKLLSDKFPEAIAKGPKAFASCVAYACDGKSLASAGGPDKAVHWWQPNPGKEATILATLKHDAPVIRVGFTSDGKTLAAGDDGGTLNLWDLDKKEARHTIKAHTGDVGALAVSPARAIVATGGPDKVIKLWDVATGKELAALPNQKGRIQALAFSPDGKILAASACDPFEKGEVRLWDVAKLLNK